MGTTSILARLHPGLMPLAEWAVTYNELIAQRGLSRKTLHNRRCYVRHLTARLGDRRMRSIRPIHIATTTRAIWSTGRAFTAQRVLHEACDLFNEAVVAGVIDLNPAAVVRPLPAPVKRSRLSLDQFRAMLDHADDRPPWVRRMLLLAVVGGYRRADLRAVGFADVRDGHLWVRQEKTGAKVAAPLGLRLEALNLSLGEIVADCLGYAPPGGQLIRKRNGSPVSVTLLSAEFKRLFEAACGPWRGERRAPTLHECRSLSERLYRAQGVDTHTLLGHRSRSMTEMYNDDRGLSREDWVRLDLRAAHRSVIQG